MSASTTLRYTVDHEWVRVESENADGSGTATIGITEFAAEQLGDIVYVDLPDAGDDVAPGAVIGEIESTKSVGELFSPVRGVVVAVNDVLDGSPELINSDPLGEGWLVRVEYSELPELLDEAAYRALIQGDSE